MISYLYAALIAVGTLVIGILLGIWIRKRAAKRAEEKISNADEEAPVSYTHLASASSPTVTLPPLSSCSP